MEFPSPFLIINHYHIIIILYIIWLVVWNMAFIFRYIWNSTPNWRTPSFFRGVGIAPTLLSQNSPPQIHWINGHCKAYVREYPQQNMAWNMVLTYLHFRILEISHLFIEVRGGSLIADRFWGRQKPSWSTAAPRHRRRPCAGQLRCDLPQNIPRWWWVRHWKKRFNMV